MDVDIAKLLETLETHQEASSAIAHISGTHWRDQSKFICFDLDQSLVYSVKSPFSGFDKQKVVTCAFDPKLRRILILVYKEEVFGCRADRSGPGVRSFVYIQSRELISDKTNQQLYCKQYNKFEFDILPKFRFVFSGNGQVSLYSGDDLKVENIHFNESEKGSGPIENQEISLLL